MQIRNFAKPNYVVLFTLMLSVSTFAQTNSNNCSEVSKPTQYIVQKGDHIAQILREFGLEPVFTSSGSLYKLLKLNQIKNPNLIEPEDRLTIPFQCEEQVLALTTIDEGKTRLITRKKIKIDFTAPIVTDEKPFISPVVEKPAEILETPISSDVTEKVLVEDQKLNDILKPEGATQEVPDIEKLPPEEISEALRYRMICEGEWTGTQCISRYSTLFATFSGWFNRYDGTDPTAPGGRNNTGILLSKFNPQIEGGWINYWNENFKTTLSASFQNNEILPEAQEVPIEQDKKLLSAFNAEMRFEFGEFGIGAGIRNFDKLYYRFRFSGLSQPCLSNDNSFAGCGVFVHSANIMSYYGNLSWIFHQQGKFTYDVKFTGAYLGSGATGGFKIDPGYMYGVDFTIRHDRVQEYLYGTIHYDMSSQDTSIEMQSAQSLGFVFGYAWKLKDW